jgi:peptidyl-dipeptidase Dcp
LNTASSIAAATADNPLLAAWRGPHAAQIPFDRVRVADFKPAFAAALAEYWREIEAIAGNPAPPSFENTLVAMERAGSTFRRVRAVYGVWESTMNLGEFPAVEAEIEPLLAAFEDRIVQNAALFARIEAVRASAEYDTLSAVQQRLVWVYENRFVRAGARLQPGDKARVAQINERLAKLSTDFSQHLLADETQHVLFLSSPADLAGLPQPVLDAAAAAAAERGRPGQWAILNTRSSVEPFLRHSERRDLRERVWRAFYSRGDNGDANDNKRLIVEILQLREERAKLLGYPSFAHWRIADTMAKTPERAMELLMRVWPAAVARVREEVADMQAVATREGAGIKIAAWDYRYYAERVRGEKFDVDMNEVSCYLQLERMREAMFWAAEQLYGYRAEQVHGLPTVDREVSVWRIKDAGGAEVGMFYFDPYARPGKRSGAWMSEYRSQDDLAGARPIVSNNSNFLKSERGPALISWDDATTLFHEFGHALHGLSSRVPYPSLSGTATVADFVELPSQLNESWLSTGALLAKFAIHYQTGRPIAPELVARIKASETFNTGFKTVEYLAAALVDLKLHLAPAAGVEPGEFERETLASLGMPPEVVMRHRTPQFAHIFTGEYYAAGYYVYLWAEVLDRDAFDAFLEAGVPYDRAVAERFRASILSVGNSIEPQQAYRNFRGREPRIEPLLRARGFAAPSQE